MIRASSRQSTWKSAQLGARPLRHLQALQSGLSRACWQASQSQRQARLRQQACFLPLHSEHLSQVRAWLTHFPQACLRSGILGISLVSIARSSTFSTCRAGSLRQMRKSLRGGKGDSGSDVRSYREMLSSLSSITIDYISDPYLFVKGRRANREKFVAQEIVISPTLSLAKTIISFLSKPLNQDHVWQWMRQFGQALLSLQTTQILHILCLPRMDSYFTPFFFSSVSFTCVLFEDMAISWLSPTITLQSSIEQTALDLWRQLWEYSARWAKQTPNPSKLRLEEQLMLKPPSRSPQISSGSALPVPWKSCISRGRSPPLRQVRCSSSPAYFRQRNLFWMRSRSRMGAMAKRSCTALNSSEALGTGNFWMSLFCGCQQCGKAIVSLRILLLAVLSTQNRQPTSRSTTCWKRSISRWSRLTATASWRSGSQLQASCPSSALVAMISCSFARSALPSGFRGMACRMRFVCRYFETSSMAGPRFRASSTSKLNTSCGAATSYPARTFSPYSPAATATTRSRRSTLLAFPVKRLVCVRAVRSSSQQVRARQKEFMLDRLQYFTRFSSWVVNWKSWFLYLKVRRPFCSSSGTSSPVLMFFSVFCLRLQTCVWEVLALRSVRSSAESRHLVEPLATASLSLVLPVGEQATPSQSHSTTKVCCPTREEYSGRATVPLTSAVRSVSIRVMEQRLPSQLQLLVRIVRISLRNFCFSGWGRMRQKQSSFSPSRALESSSMGFALSLKKRLSLRGSQVSFRNYAALARLVLPFSAPRKPSWKQSSCSLPEKYTLDPKGTLLREFPLMMDTFLLRASGSISRAASILTLGSTATLTLYRFTSSSWMAQSSARKRATSSSTASEQQPRVASKSATFCRTVRAKRLFFLRGPINVILKLIRSCDSGSVTKICSKSGFSRTVRMSSRYWASLARPLHSRVSCSSDWKSSCAAWMVLSAGARASLAARKKTAWSALRTTSTPSFSNRASSSSSTGKSSSKHRTDTSFSIEDSTCTRTDFRNSSSRPVRTSSSRRIPRTGNFTPVSSQTSPKRATYPLTNSSIYFCAFSLPLSASLTSSSSSRYSSTPTSSIGTVLISFSKISRYSLTFGRRPTRRKASSGSLAKLDRLAGTCPQRSLQSRVFSSHLADRNPRTTFTSSQFLRKLPYFSTRAAFTCESLSGSVMKFWWRKQQLKASILRVSSPSWQRRRTVQVSVQPQAFLFSTISMSFLSSFSLRCRNSFQFLASNSAASSVRHAHSLLSSRRFPRWTARSDTLLSRISHAFSLTFSRNSSTQVRLMRTKRRSWRSSWNILRKAAHCSSQQVPVKNSTMHFSMSLQPKSLARQRSSSSYSTSSRSKSCCSSSRKQEQQRAFSSSWSISVSSSSSRPKASRSLSRMTKRASGSSFAKMWLSSCSKEYSKRQRDSAAVGEDPRGRACGSRAVSGFTCTYFFFFRAGTAYICLQLYRARIKERRSEDQAPPQNKIKNLCESAQSEISLALVPMKHIPSSACTFWQCGCGQRSAWAIISASLGRGTLPRARLCRMRASCSARSCCWRRSRTRATSCSTARSRLPSSLASGKMISRSVSSRCAFRRCRSILWYFPRKPQPSSRQWNSAVSISHSSSFLRSSATSSSVHRSRAQPKGDSRQYGHRSSMRRRCDRHSSEWHRKQLTGTRTRYVQIMHGYFVSKGSSSDTGRSISRWF